MPYLVLGTIQLLCRHAGLAEYGSGSGTEEDEDDDKSSEDELWESINKKKREFAEKEKEIVASLHGKESDEVSLNTAKSTELVIISVGLSLVLLYFYICTG